MITSPQLLYLHNETFVLDKQLHLQYKTGSTKEQHKNKNLKILTGEFHVALSGRRWHEVPVLCRGGGAVPVTDTV